ncbi:hypothetical protein [Mesorhizobium huakuii]|uniref:Uncharacterized protein n=1 Tax=Mesorhizobium huakuii TaxID=28104 RepID=A0ABZ0VR98_9HYPH|nr:hypothetical protein [Mesorhizobium huakuii]WQB99743.1 hypothetical protein U0R22_003936 [Mesorhizobium huakuii]
MQAEVAKVLGRHPPFLQTSKAACAASIPFNSWIIAKIVDLDLVALVLDLQRSQD